MPSTSSPNSPEPRADMTARLDAVRQSTKTTNTRSEVAGSAQLVPAGMPAKPTLRPGTEVRWRADGDVLIGSRPGLHLHAATADLIGVVRALTHVDGTRLWSEVAAPPLTDTLLADLVHAGCIIDDAGSSTRMKASAVDAARARVVDGDADNPAEVAARRAQSRIAVVAPEPLGSALSQALTTAGVTVIASDSGAARASIGVAVHLSEGSEPRLDPRSCDPWLRTGIPHVAVSVAGTRVRISHLVKPGLTACVHCLALSADDHEQTEVARLASQHRAQVPIRHRMSLSPDTAAFCAGLVLGRVLAAVDALDDRLLDEVVVDTTGRQTSFLPRAHPACGCRLV